MGERLDQFRRSVAQDTVSAVDKFEGEFTLSQVKSSMTLRAQLFGGEIIRNTLDEMIAFGDIQVVQTIYPITLPTDSPIHNLQAPIHVYSKVTASHATQSA